MSNSGKKVQLLADAGEMQERARGGCPGVSTGREGQSRTDMPHAHPLPDPKASWNVYMDASGVPQKIPNSITLDPSANAYKIRLDWVF